MANLPEKPRGVPSKTSLYQKALYHAPRAIEVLVEAINNGENYAVKTGAAKALLAKCLPDLKSTDILGQDGQSIIQRIVIETSGQTDKAE